ncbi:hypothetical protein [Nocardia blacklockiae]|uniref:hypothetical protein n=1 Tax=Nocardia blacklockiae TaxID=480036 RepID=UPI001895B7BD|nr:hypothetical protein [Nocardia blacklockiae]MBF6175151.1 hypothetical protein [Nocardia blacklockiae]
MPRNCGNHRTIPTPSLEGSPLDRPWHAVTSRTSTPTARLLVDHMTDPARVTADAFQRVPVTR